MDLIAWIIIGLLAGWLSAMVVPGHRARGCLPNLLVGILGGIVGGFLARELRLGDPGGFLGAVLVAFIGAVIVRLVIAAIAGDSRREP
jgi:uncharacterized membrane protein YeaQ/YmgE (transglycosylase-associated protein family)